MIDRKPLVHNGGEKMKRSLLIVVVGITMLCGFSHPVQATIILAFSPSAIDVGTGSSFTVALTADIPQADAVIGWGLDLVYESTKMNLESFVIGSEWLPYGFGGLISNLEEPKSGNDVLLATLEFHCLDAGLSDIDVAVGGLLEGFLLSTGEFADWTSIPATVSQSPIPEPATLFMIGTGLAGIAAATRRKTRIDP